MMDYIIILLFVLVESFLLYRYYKTRKFFFLSAFWVIAVLFCAGRKIIPNVENCDAYYYQNFYDAAANRSFSSYMKSMGGREYLFYGFFWLCQKMNLSYTVVRVLIYSIMTAISVAIIKQTDIKAARYSDFWFLMTNFVLSYCLMRNTLAYLIGWLAILYCLKKKYLGALVLAIVGTLIHSTCIVIIAFILFFLVVDFVKNIYLIFLGAVVSYSLVIYLFPIILMFLGETNDKVAYYLDVTTNGSFALLTNLTRIGILIILIIGYKRQEWFKNSYQYKRIILLILFSFSVIFAQLVNGVAYRFLAYFNVINIISFSFMRENKCDRKISIGIIDIKDIFMILVNVLWLIMFMRRDILGYGLIPIFE